MSDKNLSLKLLKITLYALASFHIVVGIALVISKTAQLKLALLYGANLTASDQMHYLLRIVGSFAFALGLMLLTAARDPLKYRWVIVNLIVFFVFRNLQRSFFTQEVQALEITSAKNWDTNLFFWLLVIILLTLLWAAGKNKGYDFRKS